MPTVAPLATTSYVLVAQGQLDTATAQVTVVVEAIDTGLLPDRGGFMCALGRGNSARGWLLGLGLVGAMAWFWRRRRARR